MIQKITPNLWFDDKAEEAARFYVALFPNSRIKTITHYKGEMAKAGGRPEGSVMTVSFELDGQEFVGLNGGPIFKFNEAVSFVIDCGTQEEVDHYWDGLIAGGGEPSQCGWLKDRYGVSWQVTPRILIERLEHGEPERTQRMLAAMLKMSKLDIATLNQAYES